MRVVFDFERHFATTRFRSREREVLRSVNVPFGILKRFFRRVRRATFPLRLSREEYGELFFL